MAIQNLGDLKAEILSWMFDRQDLATQNGSFVTLCEADLNRVLRTRRQLATETLTLDAGGHADLPDDYLQFREVTALTNPKRVLSLVAPSSRDKEFPYPQSGLPSVFTIDGSTITVMPFTESDIRLDYWAKLPPLVEDADTNWLLEEHPGVYLYGALKHACIFIGNEQRASTMGNMFNGLLDAVMSENTLAMYSRASARVRRGP